MKNTDMDNFIKTKMEENFKNHKSVNIIYQINKMPNTNIETPIQYTERLYFANNLIKYESLDYEHITYSENQCTLKCILDINKSTENIVKLLQNFFDENLVNYINTQELTVKFDLIDKELISKYVKESLKSIILEMLQIYKLKNISDIEFLWD